MGDHIVGNSWMFMQVIKYALGVNFLLLKLFFSILDNEPKSADFCDPVTLPNSDQLCSFLHNFLTN